MGTIANLTKTANDVIKLLELAVKPLNDKLKETGCKVVFRLARRGRENLMEAFLDNKGWRTPVTLNDDDLPSC